MRPSDRGVRARRRLTQPHHRSSFAACLLFGALLLAVPVHARTVESIGDASISHEESSGMWIVGAGGAQLILALDSTRDYKLVTLEGPTGRRWMPAAATDTWTVIDGVPVPFGSRSAGFEYESAVVQNTGSSLLLAVSYRYRPANLRVVRHIAVVNGTPTFEIWTTFESLGRDVQLSDLNAFELKVQDGTVRWINGLKGSASDTPNPEAFSLNSRRLGAGEGLNLRAEGRSSESSVPWFAIDGDDDEFFAGLLWSGAWSLNIFHAADGLALSFGLTNMTTRLAAGTVEGPHVVFGAAAGRVAQASAALRRYVVDGVRGGRGFSPLVTYNTWFADGTRIDDESVRGTMARAAALGTELFVLDAGWYEGAGSEGIFDFHTGLGQWSPDPARFPGGLSALSDHAHQLGMKFGIWVEPERMDLDVVSAVGADATWLATSGGHHVSDRTGQLCLAGEAGRTWLWQRLTSFIDQVRPDYLKWDNNAWLNCDRGGHGHGPNDGNFAHVTGLYRILADLRERYPNLLIENVSGGGNRLDFGMLRYTDVGWMDDRSGPSVHVRHNVQGLSAAFPPAYLFAFVTVQDDSERLTSYQDLKLYFRSRMMGILGMSFRLPGLSTIDEMARQIALYKELRPILADAAGTLLSEQAQEGEGPTWDVFQATAPDASGILLYAFQGDAASRTLSLKPAGLREGGTYAVESVDSGPLGSASGRELMIDGIEIFPSDRTGAHILILRQMDR